jgi:hypothetical protein
MAFTSENRETLVANGRAPMLLRTGRLTVSLATPHTGALVLSIDTSRIKSPTVSFEVATE